METNLATTTLTPVWQLKRSFPCRTGERRQEVGKFSCRPNLILVPVKQNFVRINEAEASCPHPLQPDEKAFRPIFLHTFYKIVQRKYIYLPEYLVKTRNIYSFAPKKSINYLIYKLKKLELCLKSHQKYRKLSLINWA